jgi:hypothetical protein
MNTRNWMAIIAALYIAALALPALTNRPGLPTLRGIHCLVVVPWVCFSPAWWANPLLLYGGRRLAVGDPCWARNCGLAASVLAIYVVCVGGLGQVRIGYWCWPASTLALVAAGIERGRVAKATEIELGDHEFAADISLPRAEKAVATRQPSNPQTIAARQCPILR